MSAINVGGNINNGALIPERVLDVPLLVGRCPSS